MISCAAALTVCNADAIGVAPKSSIVNSLQRWVTARNVLQATEVSRGSGKAPVDYADEQFVSIFPNEKYFVHDCHIVVRAIFTITSNTI